MPFKTIYGVSGAEIARFVEENELHACKDLKYVWEGLTELLVGLVLIEKIPNCYKIWHSDRCFSSDYVTFVKPWYYLTFRIDFNPIISLYFNSKEKKPYKKIGKILQEQLDGNIADLFRNYRTYGKLLFDNFLDELGAIFPGDFAQFMGLSPTVFELEHLKKPS